VSRTKTTERQITPTAHTLHSDTLLRRLLGYMSLFTMLMTIPQVLTIWFNHQAAGVSLLSWSAYLGMWKHSRLPVTTFWLNARTYCLLSPRPGTNQISD